MKILTLEGLTSLVSNIKKLINTSAENTLANSKKYTDEKVATLNTSIGSKANTTALDSHTSNTTLHITSTERTNWNNANTHASSTHAPSNAEANQNAFSNIKVGSTTVAADSKTDTLELVGSNITITPDATNDKITFAVADGTTSAKGIVQLTNSTSSTSTTTAATPNSVKSAYDLANTAKTNAATAQATADSKVGSVSLASGTNNGTLKLTVNGTATDNIAVKGLGSAAYTASTAYATSNHNHTVSNISDLTATATELNYCDGVTSNIQTQLNGKAASSHGNHVPTTETANNAKFLRNDNTWQTVTPSNIGAAASSHGTHVSYSTTVPVMDGTASVGTASTVSRSDHVHPTDTTRAAKTDLTTHTGDTTVHITSTERTNWNTAKTHADSSHAPSNAEKNQNAFSNVTIGSTTIAADTTTDTLTLVAGSNITLTPDTTNDQITIAATNTVYTHPTTSGNKHIPSGGSSGQILRWASDGTAAWGADNNTTYTLSSFGITATAAELNALDGITATVTELNYVDGVTSNIQTQLNGKATSNHTHSYAPKYTYGTAAMTAGSSSLTTGTLYFQYE